MEPKPANGLFEILGACFVEAVENKFRNERKGVRPPLVLDEVEPGLG